MQKQNREISMPCCSAGAPMATASGSPSAVLVHHVTTERRYDLPFSVSLSGDRTANYGWPAVNVQKRHLGLSSAPSRFSKRILCFYTSTSSSAREVSPQTTNARREPEISESESDHLAPIIQRSQALRASTETESCHFQFEQMWKYFQPGSGAFVAVVASIIIAGTFMPKAAHAIAENSIGASSLGIKVADFLRKSGLSDELVVLTVATLPILELRGAIPISYWLKVEPIKGYILAVLGNMIPVPFIVLYLDKVLTAVAEKGETGSRFVQWIVDRTRKKAGPIEEFKWLGLLLFVAVPLPGTGAWSGALCASILRMPFWDAVTANFFGVALAGLLVTLLVRVGTKEAVLVGIAMIVSSCFIWSVLRLFQPKKKGASSL